VRRGQLNTNDRSPPNKRDDDKILGGRVKERKGIISSVSLITRAGGRRLSALGGLRKIFL